jgi:LemA protein
VIALIIVLVLIVLVVIFAIVTFNGVVKLRNRVDNAWSQIDVQLKRRHDLIPNLVETVKGYAAHERGTLDAVVQARNAAMSASTPVAAAQAENQITGALRQLFALSEAYPDLKANQNFLSLQEELSATEGRVAYARQFYNDAVLTYNTGIQKFPASVIAGRMGFRPREYFEAEEGSRDTPTVQF